MNMQTNFDGNRPDAELLPWNWDHKPTGWGTKTPIYIDDADEAPMAIAAPDEQLHCSPDLWADYHTRGQVDYSRRAVWVLCGIGVVVGLPLLLGAGAAIEALITAINAARMGVE